MHEKKLQVCGKRNSTIQSSYCVPFNSLVPCHLFFPRESTHLLAVLTWHFFSDGLKAPRSSSSINRDVDHIQVRFHVKERCFFIQKAILNILDESWSVYDSKCHEQFSVPKIFGFHYIHEVADFFSQETGMPCSNNIFTIQTYLSWRAIRLLQGFSKRIVPPAQIVKTMRITLLSFCEWPMGNSCHALIEKKPFKEYMKISKVLKGRDSEKPFCWPYVLIPQIHSPWVREDHVIQCPGSQAPTKNSMWQILICSDWKKIGVLIWWPRLDRLKSWDP